MRTRTLRSALGAIVVAATLVACGGGDEGAGGDAWPTVPVVAMDGSEVSSADIVAADGPTVVSLWATWCQPCKREMPMLQQLASEGDVDVVGVNIGDRPADVTEFLDELGVTYPNVIDADGELQTQVDVATLPATLVVDDGEVVWSHTGEVTRDDLDAALAEIPSGS